MSSGASEVDCPYFHDHTSSPDGWFQWWEWVGNMKKTHRQSKCSGCGKWVIWTPNNTTKGQADE